MDVFIYFCFQVIGFCIENSLNVGICDDNVCCVQFFQVSLIYFCYIGYVYVQMCDIGIQVSDVFFIVKCCN